MTPKKSSTSVKDANTKTPALPVLTLQEAIKAGHVQEEHAVAVVPKGSKGNPTERDLTKTYNRLTAKDVIGMLAMCQGDQARALKLFNTQFDIAAQVPIKHELRRAVAKPKAAAKRAVTHLQKAAEALVSSGQASSIDEAIKRIIDEMKMEGVGR